MTGIADNMDEEKKITWEDLAIALAKYYYEDVGRKVLFTDETLERVKDQGFFEKLKDYIM